MKLTIAIVLLLASLPFLVKVVLAYVAYVQWALMMPIPFSVYFGSKSREKTRKGPIGFAGAVIGDPEIAPVAINKKKKQTITKVGE